MPLCALGFLNLYTIFWTSMLFHTLLECLLGLSTALVGIVFLNTIENKVK